MMESFVYFIHICVQVVAMAQKMTALHYQYAPLIISLGNENDIILYFANKSLITGGLLLLCIARQATTTGYPINRPIWWLVNHIIITDIILQPLCNLFFYFLRIRWTQLHRFQIQVHIEQLRLCKIIRETKKIHVSLCLQ